MMDKPIMPAELPGAAAAATALRRAEPWVYGCLVAGVMGSPVSRQPQTRRPARLQQSPSRDSPRPGPCERSCRGRRRARSNDPERANRPAVDELAVPHLPRPAPPPLNAGHTGVGRPRSRFDAILVWVARTPTRLSSHHSTLRGAPVAGPVRATDSWRMMSGPQPGIQPHCSLS